MYFKEDEIQQAMQMQEVDLFDELMDMKQEATEQAQDYLVTNKFNISDFTPRAPKPGFGQQKKVPTRARKSGATGFEEDAEESGEEETLENIMRKQRGKMSKTEMN